MSAEVKKRRRSSLCANRISLLPSEGVAKQDPEEENNNADQSESDASNYTKEDAEEKILEKIKPIIKSKIRKLNEESLAWDTLLEKYSKDANDDIPVHETMNYDDIPDVVKKKASRFMTSPFSYDEVLQKCSKLVDSTFLYAENCVQNVDFLEKTQKNISDFLDIQTRQLNSQIFQDIPTMDGDIRHLIENRISITSPSNHGK